MAITTFALQIPSGQALSAPLQISTGLKLVRIGMPSDWTPAPLTFVISLDGAAWLDLYHAEQTVDGPWQPYETSVSTVTPGTILLLPPATGFNVGWLKIRSGLRARPINQAADRQFAMLFE